MSRVRWALVALAIAVAVPVALLLVRALDSAATERRMRHQVVASRTFDEMEGTLSRWLEREEARPFGAYRFYQGEGEGRVRSPLSTLPDEAFVVGAFQVDPDGSVHTPLRPRETGPARATGDWPLPSEQIERAERVLTLARTLSERPQRLRALGDTASYARPDALGSGRVARSMPESLDAEEGLTSASLEDAVDRQYAPERDAAGSARQRVAESKASRSQTPKPSAKGDASAYEVLASLNRAASLRSSRRQKVVREPRASLPDEPAAERSRPAAASPPAPSLRREARPLAETERETDAAIALAAGAAATIRITLDPMVGVPLEAAGGMLALYRTVVVDEQGYRQGLVIDLDALGSHLDAEVVRTGQLAGRARTRFERAGSPTSAPTTARYSFGHRFAEPFDALAVSLDLETLSGVGGDGALYALVGLLVVLTGAGLFAVDRMTGVVVEFAERRNNFVAAVSHELKTPLTAIRMYGEMLRDGLVADDAKRAEYYGTITDESERLSRLIDNVLEFSRLERGRRELALAAGDPGTVIREALERLGPHAAREGFRLVPEVEPDLPPVLFDRDALLQVVFNLVDNAIKYAASAERRDIVVRVARHGDGVEVGVRDFGPGVPAPAARRIFEPFYRGENELTRRTRGTGIGLALVRELAQAMGARVESDAPADGGFRVRMTLARA